MTGLSADVEEKEIHTGYSETSQREYADKEETDGDFGQT